MRQRFLFVGGAGAVVLGAVMLMAQAPVGGPPGAGGPPAGRGGPGGRGGARGGGRGRRPPPAGKRPAD